MSFNEAKGLKIVGSASIRSQQYAGDYDGYQVVELSASSDTAAGQEIARQWQANIKRLRALPDVFIGDIKCGSIPQWEVVPQAARLVDGKIVGYNPLRSRAVVDRLAAAKIITPTEATAARELLPDRLDVPLFLRAKQEIKFHIIRWTPAEILTGRKKLRDGRVIRLSQACRLPGMAKMDAIGKVQGSRFTEFSVIYEFRNKGKVLNPYRYDIRESLREAAVAYKQDGNYFKVLKRLYTLARYENDLETVKELTPLLNSDLGRLYHIVADMRTLVSLLQQPRVPIAEIRYEVDQFVGRLSGIYKLEDVLKNEGEVIGRLHSIVKMAKGPMAKALDRLADQLDGYLQYATKHVLESRKPLTGGGPFTDQMRDALAALGYTRLADAPRPIRDRFFKAKDDLDGIGTTSVFGSDTTGIKARQKQAIVDEFIADIQMNPIFRHRVAVGGPQSTVAATVGPVVPARELTTAPATVPGLDTEFRRLGMSTAVPPAPETPAEAIGRALAGMMRVPAAAAAPAPSASERVAQRVMFAPQLAKTSGRGRARK
jgi:hypothetical protein